MVKMVEKMEGGGNKHIDVLDGIRAIAIIVIVWFHFWQQTWITPYIHFDNSITKYVGITESHLHYFIRYGAVFVDVLILLSAICNLYPYARSIMFQEKWPDMKQFYLKRMIRIFPSYYFCIIIMIIFAVVQNKYTDTGFMWKDIISHLTFTSVLSSDTYLGTMLNGALWTVQVEVLYYILIPFLAKAFRKAPWITCIMLWGCSIVSSNFILYQKADNIRGWSNYFLCYAGLYANGMLICLFYLTVKSKMAENKYTQILALLFAFGSIGCFVRLLKSFDNQDLPTMQLITRFYLMWINTVFILAVMFISTNLKGIFNNKYLKFVSIVSYNLYIWHQVVAVKCKEFRIPYWEGDTPPNITGDVAWQRQYQVIILILTVIVSVGLTYGFELPIARYLRKKLHIK